MKVTPINNNIDFRAKRLNNCESLEFNAFMEKLNVWTESELKKINSEYISGSSSKEYQIEYLFFLRDKKIAWAKKHFFNETKKETILQKMRRIIF